MDLVIRLIVNHKVIILWPRRAQLCYKIVWQNSHLHSGSHWGLQTIVVLKWAALRAESGEWWCGRVPSPATLAAQTLEILKCTQLVHFIAQNSSNKRTHYYLGPLSFFFFPTTVGSWKRNSREIGNWEIRPSVGGLWLWQRESSSRRGPVPGAFYSPLTPATPFRET